MTRAQSSYLNRPLRTEAEAIHDRKIREAIETAIKLRYLLAENGGCFLASRDGETTVS